MGIYERLGVATIINAQGTITRLGGSIMLPAALEAMNEAARHYVHLDQLQRACGKRVAELMGVDDALVTNGAAGAIMLGTMACICGDDLILASKLPHPDAAMKSEVVMHTAHRNGYDFAVRNAGARIVEAGYARRTLPWEIDAAINERTACVFYVMNYIGPGSVPLEEVIEIAHGHGVPVMVDGADELPPAENLSKWWNMGADLVAFSGGKGLRGPQTTGILAGRSDLIHSAFIQANPNHYLGRPLKVGKEEMVGLVAALEDFVARDHAADLALWEKRCTSIRDGLGDLPHCAVEILPTTEHTGRPVPRVRLRLDEKAAGLTYGQLQQALEADSPPVYLNYQDLSQGLEIYVHQLQDGDEEYVVKSLKRVLDA